jgi:hypothetical protein
MYGPFIHFLRLRLIAGEVPKQEEAGRAAPTGPWTVCEATAPAGGGGGEITSRHTWLPTSNIFRHLILVLGHGSFRSISWKNNKLLLPACVPYVDRSMPVEEHV